MKLLLIAYEYPPVLAAQSVRWFYLGNELAASGIELDVLTVSIRDRWRSELELHPAIRVHRCYPGPFVGMSGWLAQGLNSEHDETGGAGAYMVRTDPDAPTRRSVVVELAERGYVLSRKLLNHLVFPDVRSEWLPFAWRLLRRLMQENDYDLIVTSHEPGVDLLLGLMAKREWTNIPWVADLADPLVTPYTPRWRRPLDRRLEAAVCCRADRLVVTTRRLADTLAHRHRCGEAKFCVVTQGFSAAEREDFWHSAEGDRVFTILYTGNFYSSFRDPGEFIAALQTLKHLRVRFVVAGEAGRFSGSIVSLGARARVLGRVDHLTCLRLQASATVLLNVGNRQADQVAGKFYEYLGARRPIVHVAGGPQDEISGLLAGLNRGIAVANDRHAIAKALQRLYLLWKEGHLERAFDLSIETVREHSWATQANRLRECWRALATATKVDGRSDIMWVE